MSNEIITTSGNPVLDRLLDERRQQEDFIDQLLEQVESESRDLVDAETRNLEAAQKRIEEIDKQTQPLKSFESLRSADRSAGERFRQTAPAGDGRMGTHTNPREYEYRSAGQFLADGYNAIRSNSNEVREAARERIQSVGVKIEGERLIRASAPHTTTAETPGLLPVNIVGDIMTNIDASRPFINSIGAKDLGGIPGTTFKRPIVTQSVTVGIQSAEKTEVEDGQFKVGSVDFTKKSFGGWTNVSRQDIDWTSPGVWDALLADFIEQYGLQTENYAADAFVTAVTAETDTEAVNGAAPTMDEWILGLYQAAALSYGGSGRLPDAIWTSLDQWVALGSKIDQLKSKTNGTGGGDSALASFAGNLLEIPRIVVPSMADGTVIVGVKSRTEVYEDRIGFLTAVEPRVLGVEMAYGGYLANGTLKPSAFAKVTFVTAT